MSREEPRAESARAEPSHAPSTGAAAEDEELVRRMNAGDSAAFEALYLRHRDWVHRQALRYVGDADEALDVLQDTFRYLLSKFPGFALRAKMTTFLFPVVRNLAIDLARKRRPVQAAEGVLEHAPDPGAAVTGDVHEDLRSLLRDLSPIHREVVFLRFVDDLSLEEIAARLQVPGGTVKSRLHNALRVLREDPRTRRHFGLEES